MDTIADVEFVADMQKDNLCILKVHCNKEYLSAYTVDEEMVGQFIFKHTMLFY